MRSPMGIAARFASCIALGLAAMTVTGCAMDAMESNTCYETAGRGRGNILAPVPCPAAEEP
jgi:hypothetical protein